MSWGFPTVKIPSFQTHLQETGETWFQHACCSFRYGSKFIVSGVACLIHGIFPFLFTETLSSTAYDVLEDIGNRKITEIQTEEP